MSRSSAAASSCFHDFLLLKVSYGLDQFGCDILIILPYWSCSTTRMAVCSVYFFYSRTDRAISPSLGGFALAASWPISMAWS